MFENQLGETGNTIVQFALALVVVIALIFLVAWLAKRLSGGRFGHVHGDEASMQVLDTLHIDTKRKLVLVRQGKLEHLLLIGGGSDEVVERSMIGGIPLAARVQATKQQEKPSEEEQPLRPTDRYRSPSRFSRSLSHKKNEDRELDRDSASSGFKAAESGPASLMAKSPTTTPTTDALGSQNKASASPVEAKADQDPKTAEKDNPDTISTGLLKSEDKKKTEDRTEPSLPDERDALQKSLDEALTVSLLDNDPPLESSAPPVEPPEPAPTAAKKSEPTATGSVNDLDLERELEAALELDSFEVGPTNTPPLMELPPLPDLPKLPGGDADETAAKKREVQEPKAEKPDEAKPGSVKDKPDSKGATNKDVPFAAFEKADKPATKDPMEPSSTPDSMKADSADEPDDKKPEAGLSPERDLPVELSGRSDPPIAVPIPSRGPAASATTLAKTDKVATPTSVAPETKPDDALDISAMLHPASIKADADTSDSEVDADELEGEMRRLLGEIAGEPDKK